MKKILSWLIVVAMIVAMMPAVFATETATTATVVTDVTELTDGQYVIFAPAYNKALTSELTGYYQVGVDVTVTEGVLSGFGETAIWDLTVNDDGTICIAQDGQNLGMAASYSSMSLGAVNDTWTVVDLESDGLVNLRNVGRSNYMEWYANYNNWSTYNSNYAATDDQFQLQFARVDVEEEIVVENPMYLGDTEFELPLGTTETVTKNFVATETGTLYVVATEFLYMSQYSDEYYDNSDYMEDFTNWTHMTINGEPLSKGFFGTVEVVKGEVYTFSWSLDEGAYYGYKAVMNLSYTDENYPSPGLGVDLLPSDLPLNTVEIPAGEKQLYTLSGEFSGYILCVNGENAYISVEQYDWWTGEISTTIIEAVDGVVSYNIDEYSSHEIYIHNGGTEAAVFEMTCYAPYGGEKNPIIVENLEDIYIESVMDDYSSTYFQWTADRVGTITVLMDGSGDVVDLYFMNLTKDENGFYDDTWTYYNTYVEEGDVLQIMVGGGHYTGDYFFEYTFTEGYREGSVQNPMVVDLLAGMDANISGETVYYTWTPDFTGTVTLDFTYRYTWSSNLATMLIGEEEFVYTVLKNVTTDGVTSTEVVREGAELAVVAGEAIVFSLSAPNSVYGTMIATVLETEGGEGGEGGEQTIILAEETVDVPASFWGIGFEYEAPGNGTVTIVIGEDHPEATVVEYGFRSNDENGNYYLTHNDGYTQTINVTAGEIIQVDLCLIADGDNGPGTGAYTGGQVTFTLTFTGTASEGGEGGEDEEPIDTELELGDNALVIEAGVADSPSYTFTATEAGTLTLTIDALSFIATDGEVAWEDDLATSFPLTLTVNGEIVEGNASTVTVVAGDVVTVMLTQNRMYVNGGYAWNANLNLAFTAGEGGEGDEPGETGTLVLGDNAIEQGITYSFTAEQDGTLIINFVSIIWDGYGNTPAYGLGSWVDVQINGQSITQFYNTVEVAAGDVVTIYMINIDSSVYTATVNLSYAEPPMEIGLGFNDLTTFQEYFYVAEQTGTLYITITDIYNTTWSSSMDDLDYYIGYQYIKITVNGEPMAAATMEIAVTEGDEVTISVNSSNYTIETEAYLSYEGFYEHPLGSARNPILLSYTDCPTTTPEIAAGEALWYKLDYNFGEAIVYIYGENAYVEFNTYDGATIRIDAVDGVVTFVPGEYYIYDIQIGNAGSEAAVFEIKADIPVGAYANPDVLEEGMNSCDVDISQTYYWTWTAPADGTVSLTFGDVDWSYYIYINDTWYAYGNYHQGTENPAVIEVKAGDVFSIEVRIQTADYSSYAGTITIDLAFTPAGGTEVLLGDANGDGEVNYMDAIMVLQYYTEEEAEGIDLVAADINNDGEVNYLDAIAILQFYVENEE